MSEQVGPRATCPYCGAAVAPSTTSPAVKIDPYGHQRCGNCHATWRFVPKDERGGVE